METFDHPDRIFTNCLVHTLTRRLPIASCVAVKGERIAAVGGEELRGLAGPGTEVIDLEGATVVPGFIDSHIHFIDYGLSRSRSADLLGCRSIGEIIKRLSDHARNLPAGRWILGHCFDQELLAEKRFPTRQELDRAFPEIPVLISRICGHACVANSRALEQTPEGLSLRERETGLVTEAAAAAVWEKVPPPSRSEIVDAILSAGRDALAQGITSVHCIIDRAAEFDALETLNIERKLPVRCYMQFPPSLLPELAGAGLKSGMGDGWLKVGSIKLFMDGSMGARTAAMHEPFSDDPGNRGSLFMSSSELADGLSDMQSRGFQAAIHAIGDRAVDAAVDGIEKASGGEARIFRHRIEHAAVVTPRSLEKMASLGIIASVQPQFVISDFWTINRVGEARIAMTYPFKTMLRRGIRLALGSDCPVERLDSIELISRAVNRNSYTPQERLTIVETLQSYCIGGAYAALEEKEKGTLDVGKLADFAVLSDNIIEVAAERIERIKVIGCVIGGRLWRPD